MTTTLSPLPVQQFLDVYGNPLVGGKLYSYAAGTTTPLATYTDSTGGTPNANPLVLDSQGKGIVWLSAVKYKLVLKTAADAQIWSVDNVNGEDPRVTADIATAMASLAASSGSSLVGFISGVGGATATTVQTKLRESVSVKDFGAKGDGITDDTLAIQAASTALTATGAVLVFPPGNYRQSGSIAFGCSISGYGATITNIIGSQQNNEQASAVIRYENQSDVFVEGITIDGNNYSTGISARTGSNLTFRDCFANNCRNMGFYLEALTDSSLVNCSATNTQFYHVLSVLGGSADGFYSRSCLDIAFTNCIADTFERIGFVSEGGTDKSARPRFTSCIARNGKNCDTTSTEYNGGFWIENTNGGYITNCSAIDIYTGVGQSNGKVVGMVIGGGETGYNLYAITNCTIQNTRFGINCSLSYAQSKIVISNLIIDSFKVGVSCASNNDSVVIENVTLSNATFDSLGGSGGVIIDLNGGSINNLVLRNVREENITYTSTDASTLSLYQNGSGSRNVWISDCQGITMRAVSGFQNVYVSNSHIYKRSSSYEMIPCTNLNISNSTLEYLAGNTAVFNAGGTVTTGITKVSNTTFLNFPSIEFSQGRLVSFANCYFVNSKILFAGVVANMIVKFNGCTWDNTNSAECIKASYNATTVTAGLKLMAHGCVFNTNATTAVLKWSYDPAYTILEGNNYSCTTLTDITTTSAVNNTHTP